MDTLPRSRRSSHAGWITAALATFSATALAASTVTVKPQTVVPQVRAFARVAPITDATLLAASDGRLEQLDVVPGSMLRSGQHIGRLGGTRVRAIMARDQALLDAARDDEAARRDTLAIIRARLLQHLSTRQDLDRAIDALGRARAQRVTAEGRLRTDRALSTLRAPATGTVMVVLAHPGERVHAGQALLRMQPDDALRLEAAFYASSARRQVHVGMPGRFVPDDGSPAIRVRVAQLPPRLRADGGQPVILVPAAHEPAHAWVSGETGTVSLEGHPAQHFLVPTRALILDRGHWWVLVRTSTGDRRQSVTPGTRRDGQTVILDGLRSGMVVIVDHAYSRFHRDIAHRYQVQD